MSFCKSSSSFSSPIWLESCKRPKSKSLRTELDWLLHLSFFYFAGTWHGFIFRGFVILSERMRRQERDTTSECALLQKGSLVCIFKQSICNFSSGTHHAKGSRTDTVKRGRVREEGNDSFAGIAFPLPLCERLQQHGGNRDKHLWGSWYERFWRASVTNKNSNILFFISSLRKLSLSVMWKWKGNNSVNTWKHCCI